MNNIKIRPGRESDVPELIPIWTEAFGDCEEFAAGFIGGLKMWKNAFVAELEGKTAGAVFLFEGLALCGRPAAYIYGLCVSRAFRSRGAGRALTDHAAEAAFAGRAELVFLRPADGGLMEYYSSMGFTAAACYENVYLELPEADERAVKELSPEEYLAQSGAAGASLQILRAQQLLFRFCGGAFLQAGNRCMCVESDGFSILIRHHNCTGSELIYCAAKAARHFGTRSVYLRRSSESAGDDLIAVKYREGADPLGENAFFPFTLE